MRSTVKWVVLGLLLLMPAFSFCPSSCAHERIPAPGLHLTAEEKKWLQQNPEPTIGYGLGFEPFLIERSRNKYIGIVPDLYRLIGKKLGINFRYDVADWKTIIKKLHDSEIDVIPLMDSRTALANNALVTEQAFEILTQVYVKKGSGVTVNSLNDLDNLKVAFNRNIVIFDKFLSQFENKISLVRAKSDLEALTLLENDKVDAAVSFNTSNYLISKHFLNNLIPTHILKEIAVDSVSAVRPDAPIFQSILNKALASISTAEKQKIGTKWLGTSNNLTTEELAYLRTHPAFTICEQYDIYPLSGIKDGKLIGMRGDYVNEIVKRTGLKLKVLGSTGLEDLKQKVAEKRCDIIGSLGSNQKIFPTVINTDTVMEFPYGVMGDLRSFNLAPYSDLTDHSFIVRFENIKNTILQSYPGLHIDVINDIGTGIKKVRGNVHFVALKPVVERVIQDYGFDKYKLNGVLDKAKQKSTMGVHQDYPMLLSIINKTIKQIDQSFLNQIYDKYSIKEFKVVRSYVWLWYIVGGLLLLLSGFQFRFIRVRKKAEEDLRDSEKWLRDLIDQSPIGLALCRMDGSLVTVNPAFADIIGYSVEDALQLTYWDITPKSYAPQERHQLKLLETSGYYGPYEKEYRHRDGHLVPVRLNGMIFTRNEEKFIWSSVEDITAIKEKNKLEEQLRHSQKVETIGRLAGGIAHDFNNILAAILGYAELALRNKETQSQSRKSLEQILSAANRAKKLVKQILVFSRREKESREDVRLDAILDESVQLLRKTIPSTVTIDLDIEKGVGAVLADSTQIHQVIMNLCTNAFHALPNETGVIQINLRQIDVDALMATQDPNLRQGKYVLLSVSDTGTGMPPEVLSRIFEPFYTTKKREEGTGLGLSVVHGIIQSHDGAIGVDSTVGQGTTFKVYLPLLVKKTEREQAVDVPVKLRGEERILFVDDEVMLAELGKKTLEPLGYKVTAMTSAEDALTLFSTYPDNFDVIITDQTMPEMTGDILAQKALLIRPDIPIIICTGHSAILNADKAKAIGVKVLLMKPVERDALALEIRKAKDEHFTGSKTVI